MNQDTFSDRDQFSLKHQQVFGSDEPIFRFSNPANFAKSLLDGNRDHLLTQARSELMKHEHQVGSLNTCSINELQQQTYAQRLEIGRRPSRICRISKRASPTARRVGHERERTSRHSDDKYARDGKHEESSRITSRRILGTKNERKT